MPKKKKTRKQKVLTDVRRQSEPKVMQTATFEKTSQTREEHVAASTPVASQAVYHTPNRNIVTADYHYLAKDLRKTILLTTAILVIQFVIKFGTGI